MPTLSPQPPVVKDEAYFQADEEQSGMSRGSPQGVALKGKISDEVCFCDYIKVDLINNYSALCVGLS